MPRVTITIEINQPSRLGDNFQIRSGLQPRHILQIRIDREQELFAGDVVFHIVELR